MGDRIARRERPSGMKMALKLTIFMAIAAVAICDESLISKEDMTKMSKDQLVSALQEAQSHNTKLSKKLSHAKKEIASLSYEDDFPTAAEEAKRKHKELAKKAALKKKSDAKRAAKMKKTEKLSDILMDHGAKFLAFKAAKKTQSAGSVKQEKAVMLAATKGGRAGAVGPLRKVIHSAAVAAVKKARAAAKGKDYSKRKMRKISVAAAKKAVNLMLKEQDVLIAKAAKKWADAAIKKFPPTVHLAKSNKPNKFTAPPTIHLLETPPTADDVVPEN